MSSWSPKKAPSTPPARSSRSGGGSGGAGGEGGAAHGASGERRARTLPSDATPPGPTAGIGEAYEMGPMTARTTSKTTPTATEAVPGRGVGGGGIVAGRSSAAAASSAAGHQRSTSHGGKGILVNREQPQQPQPPPLLPPSALKKPGKSNLKGHRRIFSHGQIAFHDDPSAMTTVDPAGGAGGDPGDPANAAKIMFEKGHKRSQSKTEFILPPGHEERERRRRESEAPGLSRSGSNRVPPPGSAPPGAPLSAGGGLGRGHRRLPSRSDSLAFSFRGHSRQASRTDSIYTLRPAGPNYKRSVFCFGRKKSNVDEAEAKHRTVVPNHTVPPSLSTSDSAHPNHQYLDNYVRTTKYTLLSFLPKNLFEQFHRFANLYFLFIVLLNWVPQINAFGKEISMMPVFFVLAVTAIKDLFEDRRRRESDQRVNNSTCRIWKGSLNRYAKCDWKDVRVGDIVRLSCDEMIPADILVLHSSDENGLCYIDTQNLDGEANLKQREVPRGLFAKGEDSSQFSPAEFRSSVECDMPTTKIYRFHGSILHKWGERVPVGKDNLLLRECLLKNTNFIEGLVVYAGHESKAMLNNGGPRYKRSKLERQMNLEVVWCVLILIALCFFGAVGSAVWLGAFEEYAPFLNELSHETIQPAWNGFLTFWTFVIIFQIIIPLSLYVTIEMTKLLQVFLIHHDRLLYDEERQKRPECRALNIPEELGQVQYIFCDKTGTLTENNMIFKRCTIGGVDYGHNSVTDKSSVAVRKVIIPVNPTLSELLNAIDVSKLLMVKKGHTNKITLQPNSQNSIDFFLLLAVCNTVIVAKQPHRDTMNASGIVCPSARIDMGPLPNLPSAAPMTTSSIRFDEEHATDDASRGRGSVAAPPLMPDPNLTPKRPNKLWDLLPTKQLSPIPASPAGESSSDSPTLPQQQQNSRLQLPRLLTPLSRIMNASTLSLLSRHGGSRSATPSPMGGPEGGPKPIYEAESPDELALVDAAYAYHVRLLKRTPTTVSVSLPGGGDGLVMDFDVLHVLPFDSTRKRMSVILKHPMTNEIILYTKGADSAMFPRLEVVSGDESEVSIVEKTQQQLNNYAKQGLRVLVMGKRVLAEDEYKLWVQDHSVAENSLHNRERLLSESYNAIERRLKLLGSTGIEDKLQDGVPEAIDKLRQAGIVVWVLTGDKQETAINIAYSCRLFAQEMEIIKLNARSRDSAETTIRYHLDHIQEQDEETTSVVTATEELSEMTTGIRTSAKNRALVIDGKTLIYILDRRANLQDLFLKLASYCSSVLCCRATPLQKAYIVRIVKEELKMHTLAIGDGANDVSMIQTADVGVGISGQEGMQAVMASDFAISRFKYLVRLLLVHGHWNYDRLARMILYFFYKNATFVFAYFWFQLYCGFSGAVMIDQMYLMLYNLLFTSLPPVAIGVLDQDVPDTLLDRLPHLYAHGRLSQVYKPYSFWLNMVDAMYQSLVIFYVAYGAFAGSDVGIWEFGTVICTECLVVNSLHLAVNIRAWTLYHWLSIIVSVLLYFVFALIYNGACVDCMDLNNIPFWVIQHSMGTVQFWSICLLAAVLALLPRVCLITLRNSLRPPEYVRVVQAYAASANAVMDAELYKSSTAHLVRNDDDGEGDDDDDAAAEARSHVFERNYRGLRKESSASQNSAHLRCSDEESAEERRAANSNGNGHSGGGLSMRLMPLNIPALMTPMQSGKVAPVALTLNGLLMKAGADKDKEQVNLNSHPRPEGGEQPLVTMA